MIRFLTFLMIAILAGCAAQTNTPSVSMADVSGGTSRRESGVNPIPAGEKLVVADLRGPGIIRHIWFTAQSNEKKPYAGLILRAWWDDETEPSIEAPLGDFFGVGFGEERLVRSAAIEMIPAGMPGHAAVNCWLPMPFRSAARIEIENQNEEELALFSLVNWEEVASIPTDTGYLHAQHRQSNPVVKGEGHIALQAKGRGRYVGLVYSIRRLSGGAWVEGGEDFYIDIQTDEWEALEQWDRTLVPEDRRLAEDARNVANQPVGPIPPSLPGIGGEDYFGTSWGFREEDRSLYHGVSLGPDDDQRMTAYRFHIVDPIYFTESIVLHLRNHGWDVQSRADDIATVAYWYQAP